MVNVDDSTQHAYLHVSAARTLIVCIKRLRFDFHYRFKDQLRSTITGDAMVTRLNRIHCTPGHFCQKSLIADYDSFLSL